MRADEFAKRVRDVVPDLQRGPSDFVARRPACGRHALSVGNGKIGLKLMCYFGCDARAIVPALGLVLEDFAERPAPPAPPTTKIQMITLGHLLTYFRDILVAARVLLQQADAPVIVRWRAAAEDLLRVAPINVTEPLTPYAERIQTALHILPIDMLTSHDVTDLIQLIDEMLVAIEEERGRLPSSEGGEERGAPGQAASSS
jgi:hypothetical protein